MMEKGSDEVVKSLHTIPLTFVLELQFTFPPKRSRFHAKPAESTSSYTVRNSECTVWLYLTQLHAAGKGYFIIHRVSCNIIQTPWAFPHCYKHEFECNFLRFYVMYQNKAALLTGKKIIHGFNLLEVVKDLNKGEMSTCGKTAKFENWCSQTLYPIWLSLSCVTKKNSQTFYLWTCKAFKDKW